MLQIILTLAIFLVIAIPMGHYLYSIASYKKTFADGFFNRVDGAIYRLCWVDKDKGMNFKQYTLSLIATNAIMVIIGYIILKLQFLPILNPNGTGSMESTLSFNTVISFITNTNLQHYAGESGLSYFSQMTVIIYMMFMSSATGYSVCVAFSRAITGAKNDMGNFYVDLVRIITRVLLPLSIIVGLLLVLQGVPQNFNANVTVHTLEGKFQDIAMGPMAALESIKHIGTNGGGFLSGNSATPLENPTVISNIIELISMMILPASCVIMFGLMCYNRKKENTEVKAPSLKERKTIMGGEGRTVFIAMSILFVIGLAVCYRAELAGNPALHNAGINQLAGNMEGKEVRFGVAQSALFTTTTTSFTTGSVNNMHDSLTPLGSLVAMLGMMLNCVFGGKGVGLMNMIMYAILGVFICGLMIGRTPEYLSKKIEGKEMKLIVLSLILHPLLILGFSAVAVSVNGGLDAITNSGFHGLSQVIYEYASSAANNGSGFEGLKDNNAFWNITTAVVMFFGRYLTITLQLAVAWSLLGKRRMNESSGTLKTDTIPFAIIMVFVVCIFAALTFLPALALGPVAEHLTLLG